MVLRQYGSVVDFGLIVCKIVMYERTVAFGTSCRPGKLMQMLQRPSNWSFRNLSDNILSYIFKKLFKWHSWKLPSQNEILFEAINSVILCSSANKFLSIHGVPVNLIFYQHNNNLMLICWSEFEITPWRTLAVFYFRLPVWRHGVFRQPSVAPLYQILGKSGNPRLSYRDLTIFEVNQPSAILNFVQVLVFALGVTDQVFWRLYCKYNL